MNAARQVNDAGALIGLTTKFLIRWLLVVPLALALASEVRAQDFMWAVNYGVSQPLSNTKDFTDGTSFRNVGMEWLYAPGPHVAIGVSANWSVFDSLATDVASFGGGEFQGTQFRYINTLPILATVRYLLGESGKARPFMRIWFPSSYAGSSVR